MPPFVPPPNPPALIQPIALDPQGNCLEILNEGLSTHTILGKRPPLISQIPILMLEPPSLESSEKIPATKPPGVIEFYLSDPKEITTKSLPPNSSSEDNSARTLGSPISVGKPSSTKSTSTMMNPVPNLVFGLNQSHDSFSNTVHRLVTRKRRGPIQEFKLITSSTPKGQETSISQQTLEIIPESSPELDTASIPEEAIGVVELIADRQEYDSKQEVVYAEGNVVMRFANGVLLAKRMRVNLPDQFVVAEGEVVLERGEQTLRGEKFEYYFVQDQGVVFNANGEIYQPTTGKDFSPRLPNDSTNDLIPNQTLNERLAVNQPLQRITTTEGFRFGTSFDFGKEALGLGSDVPNLPATQVPPKGGQINRIRFQSERMEFDGDGWSATNARLTNDPFSPPELEIRAETATFRNIAPLVDEVKLTNSRVVLDQTNSFPTQDRLILDRRDRQPGVISFGYDDRDRGGLYVERGFNIVDDDMVSWELKPQYYIQKGLFPDSITTDNPNTDLFDADTDDIDAISPPTFGLINRVEANFSKNTKLFSRTSLTSLDFNNRTEEHIRTKTYFEQKVPLFSMDNDLRFEYNYRERLFNGSLGFQTVRDSLGLLFVSPQIPLDQKGLLRLSYQASLQNVNADTDQPELLAPIRENNRVTLFRTQGAASVSRPFMLWVGKALPPTSREGLRYTSTPVLPFVQLSTSVTGVASLYGNGDSQPSISGSIGVSGQLGNFSRPFFDYTGFNLSFSQALRGDPSPFLFDRFADLKTISWALTQQLYGPVRFGVQSALNIDTDDEINTDLFLEYSRRTYNILLRYNSRLQVGSISLRISDFNWSGDPGPFDGTGIRPVIQGVPR
ncbi:MAG: DUF3769 domain-containing protein [cyanobacterium endosymbiont of Epithemia adnata isolate EadnSB Bon19]